MPPCQQFILSTVSESFPAALRSAFDAVLPAGPSAWKWSSTSVDAASPALGVGDGGLGGKVGGLVAP